MQKWINIAAALSLVVAGIAGNVSAQESPAQFEDGQTVVFLGDSITQGGLYQYYVQLFYATRFTERKIFIENAGIGGSTAAGSLIRLDTDVIAREPDAVYILFGMNDVGRNNYKTELADERLRAVRVASLKNYQAAMETTLGKIKAAGASVTVMTPSPYDQYTQNLKTENLAACNDGLAALAAKARSLAIENQCAFVDLHTPMTALMRARPGLKLSGSDRVHPDQTGHMVMAYYILQEQKVPGLVAETVIDYSKSRVERAFNCSHSGLETGDSSVRFTYTPGALPFPVSDEYEKANQIVPWESLNREIIRVEHLPAGEYRLLIDGKETGRFSHLQFEAGVNIAALDTPQQRKSVQLRDAVIAKQNADRPLRILVQGNCVLWQAGVDPADIPAADRCLDDRLAAAPGAWKKQAEGVYRQYREYREKLPELSRKARAAQDAITRLQSADPCLIEIIKSVFQDG